MAAEKALALVLRAIEFSESSLVLTLFTREFGKVRALAKGGRRLKGPFESALDLLTLCRIVFLRKSSEALDLLTEAKLVRRFRPAGRDLASLYAGYYVAELLGEWTDDYDPHPELFDLADQTLEALSTGEPVLARVMRFELVGLRELGHLPLLRQCVECGREVPLAGRVPFSELGGGVLCGRCRAAHRDALWVGAGTLRTIADLAEPEGEAWKRLALSPAEQGELRRVVNRYLYSLLGHKPRMHEHLGLLSG